MKVKTITSDQFKAELAECAKRGFGFAATIGWMTATMDLSEDEETNKIIVQIIDNEQK